MKHLFCLILAGFFAISPVLAEEVDPDLGANAPSSVSTSEEEEGGSNVPTIEEVYQTFEYNFLIDEPIATYQINSDDIVSEVSTYAITGDVYQGSINSTILTAWEGIIANNIGKQYLGFRGSQYDYYLFVGEGFTYSNGSFTGSGTVYSFNTYSSSYVYSISTDSFNISPSSAYVYTNVGNDYPRLTNEGGLLYAYIENICLLVLIGLTCVKWIFTRR